MKYLLLGLITFGVSFPFAIVLASYSLLNHNYELGYTITPIFLPIILSSIILCSIDKSIKLPSRHGVEQ